MRDRLGGVAQLDHARGRFRLPFFEAGARARIQAA
jgi:hypothetical protein